MFQKSRTQSNFGGRKWILFENAANLDFYADIDGAIRSVKVFRGPSYTAGSVVRLHENNDFGGRYVDLVPGEYPDLSASLHDIVRAAKSAKIIG